MKWLLNLRQQNLWLYKTQPTEFHMFWLLLMTPLVIFPWGLSNFSGIKYTVFICLMALAVWKRNHMEKLLFNFPIKFSLWFAGAGTLASSLVNTNRINIILGQPDRWATSWLFLTAWFIFLIFCFSIIKNNTNATKLLITASLTGAAGLSGFIILEYFKLNWLPEIHSIQIRRPSGLLGNANFSAMYLSVLIPFWIQNITTTLNNKRKLALTAIWILNLTALLMLASRGAVIAGIIGLISFLFLGGFKNKTAPSGKIWASLGLTILIAGIFYIITSRPETQSLSEINTHTRTLVWVESAKISTTQWLTGAGLGNFETAYLKNRSAFMGAPEFQFNDPHNVFLLLLFEGGIFWLISISGLILAGLYTSLKAWFSHKDPLAVSAFTGLSIWCLAASVNPVEITNWLILGLILAICFSFSLGSAKEFKITRLKLTPIRLVLGAGSLLLIGMLVSEPLLKHSISAPKPKSDQLYFITKLGTILNPTQETSYKAILAQSLLLDKTEKEIIRHINNYIALYPYSFRAHRNSGVTTFWLYIKTQKSEYKHLALKYFNTALVLNPYDAQLLEEFAKLAFVVHEDELVKQLLLTQLTLPYKSAQTQDSLAILARLYQEEKKYTETLRVLKDIAQTFPEDKEFELFYRQATLTTKPELLKLPVTFIPNIY